MASGGRTVLRDVTCQLGELARADGSARYRQGRTEVLCSLVGPLEAPDRRSDSSQAIVEVMLHGRAQGVRSGGSSRVVLDMERYDETLSSSEMGSIVRSCMEAALATTSLPRQRVCFTIQVLEDDGALLSTCVNAAMLALLDSGLACVSTLAAAEACTSQERLILDPTEEDVSKADSLAFFAHFTDEAGGVVACNTTGPAMNNDVYWLFHRTTKSASLALSNLFRRFVKEQKQAGREVETEAEA